ncbi:MAG: hypothetical protein RXR02_06105 [Thermoproteus sp.]
MSRPKAFLTDRPSAGSAPEIVSDLLQTVRRLREGACCWWSRTWRRLWRYATIHMCWRTGG